MRASRSSREAPFPQRPAQVGAARGVEAEIPHAVGGEPAPVAAAAEGRGGGRDDPEHAAVGEAEAVGGRRALLHDRLDRPVALGEPGQDLLARHHAVHAPVGRATHVHVLDEAHLRGDGRRVLDQVGQLVVVDPTHHDRVELEPGPARLPHRRDALQHPSVRIASGQRLEAILAQRVEADRDPVEARRAQRGRLLGQQHPVRGHGQVLDARVGREEPHEPVEVAPEQRLTAGETHLVHPQVGEDVHEPVHLLEGQHVIAGQPDVLLLGHAVLTAQVAAVGDREPQVA